MNRSLVCINSPVYSAKHRQLGMWPAVARSTDIATTPVGSLVGASDVDPEDSPERQKVIGAQRINSVFATVFIEL